jgi:acyl carrier protein
MSAEAGQVTHDEVIGFIHGYLEGRGMTPPAVDADTPLASLGLDSISLVELLLSARDRLVAEGRLPSNVTLTNLPTLDRVSDLTALFRGLVSTGVHP